MSLYVTIGIFLISILAFEASAWALFQRKMAPLRFPANTKHDATHTFWLHRLRLIAILHALTLMVCSALFCMWLW